MPKAILEFNLPEEQEEFKTANKAQDYLCVLVEIADYLRVKRKYEISDTLNREDFEKFFYNELKDRGIEL